jgi:hypothetical protein
LKIFSVPSLVTRKGEDIPDHRGTADILEGAGTYLPGARARVLGDNNAKVKNLRAKSMVDTLRSVGF